MKDWKKNPFRIVWLFIGFLCMGIGAAGVVLPVLPTTPFLLLASFCLAKGSVQYLRQSIHCLSDHFQVCVFLYQDKDSS